MPFQPFARYLEIIEDDYELFSESGIQMLYYASTWIVSAICLSREDWFWDPFYVFEGNFPNQPMGYAFLFCFVLFGGVLRLRNMCHGIA